MYLKAIKLENIRSHTLTKLEFDPQTYAGWHVILGDNGAGKSTLVRAIALALAGPTEIAALRQDWRDWLRAGCDQGSIQLRIEIQRHVDQLKFSQRKPSPAPPTAVDTSIPGEKVRTRGGAFPNRTEAKLVFSLVAEELRGPTVEVRSGEGTKVNPQISVWGAGRGWFSASYGPFRRFTGGNKDYEKLFYSNPKLAPHLTAFGEDVALTEAITWLQQLRVRELESQLPATVIVNLIRFINESGLLPPQTRLAKITGNSVLFEDASGCQLAVEQLSDGYRSILSLTFELIRQLARAYGQEAVWEQLEKSEISIDLPGVVMIDEVDAHLHPTWQRRIGQWFRERFPKIQFIVTTHSPLICQAADVGSIWKLGKPGEPGIRKIEGTLRDRLVFGSVLDALDTDLFGEDVARSEAAKVMLERLAELNLRLLRGQLSAEQRTEMEKLRRTFPSEADE